MATSTTSRRVPLADLPSLTFSSDAGQTVRRFADKLPIGIGDDGRTFVFLYLVTRPSPADFPHVPRARRRAVAGAAGLVRPRLDTAPPVPLDERYREAFREHVGTPLRPSAARGAAVVLRGAAVRIQETGRRAVRPRETCVRDTAVSGSVSRLDRAGRPCAGRCRLADSGDCDRASDRANSRPAYWRIGISISPFGRHGVSAGDTSARGGWEGR